MNTPLQQRHFIKGIKRLSQLIVLQPDIELVEIVQKSESDRQREREIEQLSLHEQTWPKKPSTSQIPFKPLANRLRNPSDSIRSVSGHQHSPQWYQHSGNKAPGRG